MFDEAYIIYIYITALITLYYKTKQMDDKRREEWKFRLLTTILFSTNHSSLQNQRLPTHFYYVTYDRIYKSFRYVDDSLPYMYTISRGIGRTAAAAVIKYVISSYTVSSSSSYRYTIVLRLVPVRRRSTVSTTGIPTFLLVWLIRTPAGQAADKNPRPVQYITKNGVLKNLFVKKMQVPPKFLNCTTIRNGNSFQQLYVVKTRYISLPVPVVDAS